MSNQPFLYDPQANVLRQRASINRPTADNVTDYGTWSAQRHEYDLHIASLPAYTPISGWVPEVGREYTIDVDFKAIAVTDSDMRELHTRAVPIEQKQECKTYAIGGYAPGNYHCTCCICGNKFIGDKRAVSCFECESKAKSFTLQDMIECWEAAESYGYDACISVERAETTDEKDKYQYFKDKFNIDLP